MAEKKQEFQYGSAFLPEGEKKYSVIRWGWNGLNREDKIDTGQLTDMSGMVCDPPRMEPQKDFKVWIDFQNGIPVNSTTVTDLARAPGKPISIAGFDNQLVMVWEYKDDTLEETVYRPFLTKFWQCHDEIRLNQAHFDDYTYSTAGTPRSIVQFNVVDTSSGNIVNYTYDRKLMVYPDCFSVPYAWNTVNYPITASDFNTDINPIPETKMAAVYNSRVFGTNNNATFASDYNSYAAYNLDTADDISSAHAWWSMTNTNTEADGAFTAMCTFDNHVVLFKKDFMQLVYNNKNPFRVVDVGAFGCDSNKAWTILNGVLYFASQEKVYAYTGGTPKEISQKLEIESFKNAVLGSYKDKVWVYVGNHVYTFSNGIWSDVKNTYSGSVPYKIRQFATLDFGLVALCEYTTSSVETNYYKLLLVDWDTDLLEEAIYTPSKWEEEYSGVWDFTTDLMVLGRLDVRRVKKFSMLCEGDKNATVSVYLLKDGESPRSLNADRLVGTLTLDSDGFHLLRVLTRQFSSTMHQLYFVGRGYMKIYAAELKIAWGGDLYVES